jgi:hypothetical protein
MGTIYIILSRNIINSEPRGSSSVSRGYSQALRLCRKVSCIRNSAISQKHLNPSVISRTRRLGFKRSS